MEAFSEEKVVFTKRSDAEDEAVRVNGRIDPVYDKEGNITGYKVFGRMELTLSEDLSSAAQFSSTPAGDTDASVRAILGDTLELAKGRRRGRGGQDPIDYEQLIAKIPGGSLSYQQEHGDQDFESRELQGQYFFPVGGADVSVHGGVRGEQRRVQQFFQKLMKDQKKWNFGAGAQGPIGEGVASLGFNRRGGDTKPVTDIFGQYAIPLGPGEATFSGAIQDGDWQIGAGYKVPF